MMQIKDVNSRVSNRVNFGGNFRPIVIKGDIGKNFFNGCASMSSAMQRGIIGVTALLTQPFIDYYNPQIDEDTRNMSVDKTIAKVIVGTLTGVVIRAACVWAISRNTKGLRKFLEEGKDLKNMKEKMPFIMPSSKFLMSEGVTKLTVDTLDKYTQSMGTLIATIIMLVTNFVIDAPLTNMLTNFIHKVGDPPRHKRAESEQKALEFTSEKQEVCK